MMNKLHSGRFWAGLAVGVAAYLVAPFVLNGYLLDLVNLIGIAAVAAIGMDILIGYAGQLSVGHAAFAAVGGYTVATLGTRLGAPFWLALPAAAVLAGLVSVLFGLVAVRVRGLYLAITTLAAQFVIAWVFNHWSWLTGGFQAAAPVPPARLGAIDTTTRIGRYYLVVSCLVLAVLFALNLFRSRTGRALMAIRDHSHAAAGTGISVFRYTLLAFFVSACYAGLSGGLFAYNTGVVTTEFFPFALSISYIAMIIIGGVGSVAGAITGAAVVTLLPVALREGLPLVGVTLSAELTANLHVVLFGVLLLVFLVAEPGGLVRLFRRGGMRLRAVVSR
jgi:branched-chain amino acid transport system permease protein